MSEYAVQAFVEMMMEQGYSGTLDELIEIHRKNKAVKEYEETAKRIIQESLEVDEDHPDPEKLQERSDIAREDLN